MIKEINISLSPEISAKEELYIKKIASKIGVNEAEINHIEILKRSIDARKRDVKIVTQAKVWINEIPSEKPEFDFKINDVSLSPEIIIVGAGPAGLFAALSLIEKNIKPLIIERGKTVSERKKDLSDINKNRFVNPESNYCFGEGGAGTFSDGKLYTRSKKRGDVKKILDILKFHGADEKILTDAHPHIGTNNLPRIIQNIRKTILEAGGEIIFDSKVVDFIIKDNEIKGVVTEKGDKITGKAVILAAGHSARDIYELLHNKNIKIEAKPFAMGVRVEHPQEIIDSIQYHSNIRNEYLPAAAYSLVTQAEGRGVYSFCMCPGGFIVPAATNSDEIVVNGMSPSSRNSFYANSGIVVEIKIEDFPEYEKHGDLAGLRYQQNIEKTAFQNGGQGIIAPAQLLTDFIKGKLSQYLPDTSYHPGIISSPIHFWLPESIGKRLQAGFKDFGKKMRGFITEEAVVLGVESRTSSPVRIPRDKKSLQHPQIKNLYPCSEGAGYAGGIVSAAMDGIKCAEMIAKSI